MYYLKWDNENKRFYSDLFMLALPVIGKKQYILTIGGKEVEIDSEKMMADLQKEKYRLPNRPQVKVIEDSVLYIRMPMMSYANWYIKKIGEAYTPGVKKIVFDVRNNPGGDDNVWKRILSSIIAEPFEYTYAVGMNYDERLKNCVSGFGDIKVENGQITIHQKRTIEPDSAGLHFSGKLYLIQDGTTYSAAAAFAAAAMQNRDKITVVGQPSILISGYTFPAITFSLPHSRLVYRLAFSYDLTGGPENPYMDKVHIIIKDSIKDYLSKLYDYDSSVIDEFIKKDAAAKYVISR